MSDRDQAVALWALRAAVKCLIEGKSSEADKWFAKANKAARRAEKEELSCAA